MRGEFRRIRAQAVDNRRGIEGVRKQRMQRWWKIETLMFLFERGQALQ